MMDAELRAAVLKVAEALKAQLNILERYQWETSQVVRSSSPTATGRHYAAKAFEEASQLSLAYSFQLLVREAREVPNDII